MEAREKQNAVPKEENKMGTMPIHKLLITMSVPLCFPCWYRRFIMW